LRYCIVVCACSFLLLAGCARLGAFAPTAPTTSTVLGQVQRAPAAGFRVIHQFRGAPNDGQRPVARLTEVNGTLYGTTELGGAENRGTAFEIPAGGAESVFYNFTDKDRSAAVPRAGLLSRSGGFFGPTFDGGASGVGTVYRLTPYGKLRVIHSFARAGGAGPRGDLISLSGDLYGTTEYGGAHDKGTLFEISATGSHRVLHSFTGGSDGAYPRAGLELLGGKLYGTTYKGGADDMGTVFEATINGTERVLHSFRGKPKDGESPQCTLVALNGALYGTTVIGGSFGFGTIFEVKADGAERILFDFNGKDGEIPLAGLTVYKGLLYGTASEGSKTHGKVFELDPATLQYRVLHDFHGGDGSVPRAGLIEANGKLYGTTSGGGTRLQGVVFEVTP
jgi:uncharacterized repeat protein (TIGR03803 family)